MKASILFSCMFFFFWEMSLAETPEKKGNVEQGKYLFQASGGCSCHTDRSDEGAGEFLAGGRTLLNPFGKMYSTNLTPDPETGIGKWSDEDFINAMTKGIAPDGSDYFPAFPFTSFTKMNREDLLNLKAYLFSLPPIKKHNREHDLPIPFSWRVGIIPWKILNFNKDKLEPNLEKSESWNRGAYLVEAVAHCRECHTPRDFMGGLKHDMAFAGTEIGPENEPSPNITPHKETGIGGWSRKDFLYFLETGLLASGDYTQGVMEEVIEHGYQHLTQKDREAITDYIFDQPSIENTITAFSNSEDDDSYSDDEDYSYD